MNIKALHLNGNFLYSGFKINAVVSNYAHGCTMESFKGLRNYCAPIPFYVPTETWFIAPISFECSFKDMIHHEPWWVNILGKYYTGTHSSTHLLSSSFKLPQFHRNFVSLLPWGLCCQKQASTAWITNNIQQYSVWCNYLNLCLKYLLLTPISSHYSAWCNYL